MQVHRDIDKKQLLFQHCSISCWIKRVSFTIILSLRRDYCKRHVSWHQANSTIFFSCYCERVCFPFKPICAFWQPVLLQWISVIGPVVCGVGINTKEWVPIQMFLPLRTDSGPKIDISAASIHLQKTCQTWRLRPSKPFEVAAYLPERDKHNAKAQKNLIIDWLFCFCLRMYCVMSEPETVRMRIIVHRVSVTSIFWCLC